MVAIPLDYVSPRSKYALVLLTLIYMNSHWSRYLLNYLYAVSSDDPDKSLAAGTGITTSEYGLLAGFGFGVTYVTFGMVMGRAADLYNRCHIIVAGLVIWSAANVLCGAASDFKWLLASRVLLGFGESFSGPASYSLLADFFPPSRRAEANGVYAVGMYMGASMGSFSLSIAMAVGWRNVCYGCAASGLVLAMLLLMSVREPQRVKKLADAACGAPVASPPLPPPLPQLKLTLPQALRAVLSRRLVLAIIAAAMVRYMAGYTIGTFMPVFYGARFPDDADVYSYLNASIIAIGGAVSAYVGGRTADRWAAAGQRRAYLLIPGAGAAAAVPLLAAALYAPSFGLSMAALFAEYLCAEVWSGPAVSALQGALPPGARGTGMGVFALGTGLAGSAAAWAVGAAAQRGSGGSDALRGAVAGGAGAAYALCAALFFGAAMLVRPRKQGYEEIV
ncbi:major facilitator superfamily domain-containing protein [Tribonema minus]|uniref:Major facilitator superfamily domain-containing protein n=1 Tax=Tribonema minus TaxID=303371 RepID=A0A835YUX0_9STRA|nr:major facilitator superfamily domain-containing protein [Tribonema minus]